MSVQRASLRLAIVAVAILPLVESASAQQATPHSGMWARVTAPDAGRAREVAAGRLVSFDGDTAVISRDDRVMRVALDSGRTLEVRVPGRKYTGTGALVGLGVGVLVPLVAPCEEPEASQVFGSPTCDSVRSVAMVLGGLVGAGLGALIGSGIRAEEWRRVSPDARVSIAPRSGGRLVFGVSIGF